MENIIKGIRQYYPVSDSSLEVLFSHMEKLELPKKHLLIRGGVADRHVYFIEKGFFTRRRRNHDMVFTRR